MDSLLSLDLARPVYTLSQESRDAIETLCRQADFHDQVYTHGTLNFDLYPEPKFTDEQLGFAKKKSPPREPVHGKKHFPVKKSEVLPG
jgi:hypothetical protein